MLRRSLTTTLAVLVLSLSACDFSFSEGGGEVVCVDGARLSATTGDETYVFDGGCVEAYVFEGNLVIASSQASDDARGDGQNLVVVHVDGTAPGTYAIDNDDTFANYTFSPDEGNPVQTNVFVGADTGRVVIASASGGRARGTFEFSGREERTVPGDPAVTYGPTRTVTGTFDVPLVER